MARNPDGVLLRRDDFACAPLRCCGQVNLSWHRFSEASLLQASANATLTRRAWALRIFIWSTLSFSSNCLKKPTNSYSRLDGLEKVL